MDSTNRAELLPGQNVYGPLSSGDGAENKAFAPCARMDFIYTEGLDNVYMFQVVDGKLVMRITITGWERPRFRGTLVIDKNDPGTISQVTNEFVGGGIDLYFNLAPDQYSQYKLLRITDKKEIEKYSAVIQQAFDESIKTARENANCGNISDSHYVNNGTRSGPFVLEKMRSEVMKVISPEQ